MEGSERKNTRLIVLVVDRDDDIGRKTGRRTPIIGRDENLEAAKDLALSDPEESDANAMFGAIKLYDELQRKIGADNVMIATIAGLEKEGLEADEKIGRELDEVLKRFPANGCILISDGLTDQFVVPIITSRVPIVSIKRVVVRQSESIERTWLLLGRYLKMALFEARYSKIILGIPGVLLLLTGVLYAIGLVNPAILFILIGIVLLFRGFGLDTLLVNGVKSLLRFISTPSIYQIRMYAIITSVVILLFGIYLGYIGAISSIPSNAKLPSLVDDPAYWIGLLPSLIGNFLLSGIDTIFISFFVIMLAYGIFYLLVKDAKFWRIIQTSITLIWLWALLKRAGILLTVSYPITLSDVNLIVLIIVGILGVPTVAITYIVTRYMRKVYASYFKKMKHA